MDKCQYENLATYTTCRNDACFEYRNKNLCQAHYQWAVGQIFTARPKDTVEILRWDGETFTTHTGVIQAIEHDADMDEAYIILTNDDDLSFAYSGICSINGVPVIHTSSGDIPNGHMHQSK